MSCVLGIPQAPVSHQTQLGDSPTIFFLKVECSFLFKRSGSVCKRNQSRCPKVPAKQLRDSAQERGTFHKPSSLSFLSRYLQGESSQRRLSRVRSTVVTAQTGKGLCRLWELAGVSVGGTMRGLVLRGRRFKPPVGGLGVGLCPSRRGCNLRKMRRAWRATVYS